VPKVRAKREYTLQLGKLSKSKALPLRSEKQPRKQISLFESLQLLGGGIV
jgi:hypothetical protein